MRESVKESERLKKYKRKKLFRIIEIALVGMITLSLVSFLFYNVVWKDYFRPEEITYSEMVTKFGLNQDNVFGYYFAHTGELEKIERVEVRGGVFVIKWKDKDLVPVKFRVPQEYFTTPALYNAFAQKEVIVQRKMGFELEVVLSVIVPILLALGIVAAYWWLPKRGYNIFGSQKTKKIKSAEISETRFTDIAGIDEAVEEVRQVVEQLTKPESFEAVGARMIKGVLLTGPPGCGKTLLAKAVAGEAGVSFIEKNGSEFVEVIGGLGPKTVRELFKEAKENPPCIIFIDEIDGIGKTRGGPGLTSGAQNEREATLNQLFIEMDGFSPKIGVVVLAATNRPDLLDRALKRPGRFDREIVVPKPDIRGRGAILKVHTRDKPLAEDVDLSLIAKGTSGFSGADLADLANKAAIQAAEHLEERDMPQKGKILMEDFQYARDQILMGEGQEKLLLSDEEKEHLAFYEGAKVIVARLEPFADPVYKVSIVSRGLTMGKTQLLPEEERHFVSDKHMLARVKVLLAGRAVEEILEGEGSHIQRSSRAAEDFQKATQLVTRMLCELGMDKDLGPRALGKKEELSYQGSEIVRYYRDFSEDKSGLIDKKIREVLLSCLEDDKKILRENREALTKLAEKLLEEEELEAEKINELLKGQS